MTALSSPTRTDQSGGLQEAVRHDFLLLSCSAWQVGEGEEAGDMKSAVKLLSLRRAFEILGMYWKGPAAFPRCKLSTSSCPQFFTCSCFLYWRKCTKYCGTFSFLYSNRSQFLVEYIEPWNKGYISQTLLSLHNFMETPQMRGLLDSPFLLPGRWTKDTSLPISLWSMQKHRTLPERMDEVTFQGKGSKGNQE